MADEFEPSLVSIIIPTFNRANMITKAFESALAQTYRPIECIVVDDGSTDGTRRVIEGWGKELDSEFILRYVVQENAGGCAARNRGLCASNGEFINFLDSDDRLLPGTIKRKVDCLRSNATAYCYDRGLRVDGDGNELGFHGRPWTAYNGLFFLTYHFDVTGPLIRRQMCARIGPWDKSLRGHQEVEYFARLKLHAGRGVFLDEVGHVVVEHDGPRIVGSKAHADAKLACQEIILKTIRKAGSDYAHEAAFLEGMLKLTYANMAREFYLSSNSAAAMRCLKKAREFGYRNWHVRGIASLHDRFPSDALVRSYFWTRDICHSAKRRFSKPFQGGQAAAGGDEVSALFAKLDSKQ
jgi:glycosyltransferase involved in cell wall biosynthesis